MRRASIGLVFVLLAVACSNSPSAPHPSPSPQSGVAARAVGSDLFVCPGGYAWAGYGQLVYAPNDTTKPTAEVRPDRCFASLGQAIGGGFHLRPAPPGGELIDTIYLVPPDPPMAPVCRTAAMRLRFTVLCPDLVPGDANSMVDCEDDCVFLHALVLSFSFSTPPGSVGIPGQTGNHLFVMESRDGRQRTVEFLTCLDRRASRDATVQGTVARWFVCPENGSGMNSGHVMLVWVQDGIRYAVSLHSDTELNRRIALDMAEHLVPVSV